MTDFPPPTEPVLVDTIVAHPIFAPPPAAPLLARPTRPLDLPHISRGAAGVGVAMAVALLIAMLFVSELLGGLIGAPRLDGSTESAAAFNRLIVIDKWVNGLLALGALILVTHLQGLALTNLGLHARRPGRQLGWAFAALGGVLAALLFSSVLVMILVTLFPHLQDDLSNRLEFISVLTANDLASTVALLAAVAIHEEVLFRGLLIPYLCRLGCGWVGAVLLSAGVFAVLHISQGWLAIPQIFCVGLALGAFFVWSRSLTAVMLTHFLYNLAQFQLAPLLLRWAQQVQPNV